MQLIPAKIAECKNIVICTPPNKEGKIAEEILWIAKKYNISKVYKVGGSQAIFAMAYGNTLIPKVEKIFGPGNQYVNLAKQIVSDGEGAKKFITVKVINARSQQMARTIAFSIANSPLFKTAMAGEDPNWGRIIMAIGKSGEKISPDKIEIKFGELKVAEKGKISDEYDEAKLKEYMKWDDLKIEVNLKLGQGSFECYTCDLTNDYININADYRN